MTYQNFAEFNGNQIPVIQHENDAWFTSKDIGKSLGYSRPSDGINKIFERNKNLLSKYSTTVKLTVEGGIREPRIFNEEGVMIVTMKSGQPKADEFIEWAVKILKAYRHGQLTSIVPQGNILVKKDEYIDLLQAKTSLLEYKLQPKWRPILEEEAKQMLALQRQGLGVTAIAQQMDRSTSGVRAALNRVTQH